MTARGPHSGDGCRCRAARPGGPCHVDEISAHRAIHRGRSRGKFGCLAPRGEGLDPELTVVGSRDQVTAGGEGIGDGGVSSEEALRRARRAEALHLALSSPDRDVRATFRPVVLALALDVFRREAQLASRCAIGPYAGRSPVPLAPCRASSATCSSAAERRACRVGFAPACRGLRPRYRPRASNTSAGRRSSRTSRPGATDCSGDPAGVAAALQSAARTSLPRRAPSRR